MHMLFASTASLVLGLHAEQVGASGQGRPHVRRAHQLHATSAQADRNSCVINSSPMQSEPDRGGRHDGMAEHIGMHAKTADPHRNPTGPPFHSCLSLACGSGTS